MRKQSQKIDKKFKKLQTRKVISAYGGIGSIIETTSGALLIEDFDKWSFFRFYNVNNVIDIPNKFHISDERLLKRLNHKDGFSKLEAFVHVPANNAMPYDADEPENDKETISAKYFPRWFYCNNCNNFKHINEWWKVWQNVKGRATKKSDFVPPKCGYCFETKKYAPELEQVRFVMTSPEGDIDDLPWKSWNGAQKNIEEEDSDRGNIRLDYVNLCCQKQRLQYLKSNKYSDLSGIRIKCVNSECSLKGKEVNLAGLFGLRKPKMENNDDGLYTAKKDESGKGVFLKPVIRTSNSIYYPITVSSIYLPTDKGILLEDQKSIDEWLSDNKDLDFIYRALKKKYPIEIIEKYINKKKNINKYEPEVEYRLTEYRFLTNNENNKYEDPTRSLIFAKEPTAKVRKYGIDQLIGIKKLKITTVQTGYTRQEPLTGDDFLLESDDSQANIKGKFTSVWEKQTKYLPAIENYGEGFFISLSNQKIENWLKKASMNNKFNERVNRLYQNCKNHEYKTVREKIVSEKHLIRLVLIHTLSHLLIKELEFLCGYPASSLSERLFVDEKNMQGFIIYTVAGAEGSYGGLVSQANEINLLRILKAALNRSSDCASDPICYSTEDGQGIGGLNMAACYSCSLVPENTCEEFNSFLDRALLIDKDFGFFYS